jgi:hypothetical protein
MKTAGWGKTLNDFRQELISIKGRAHAGAVRFEELRRHAECLKMEVLVRELEDQRKSLVRSRGSTSIARDRKILRTSLGIAAATSLVTGILTKDKLVAANAGLSILDSVLKGLGETDCVVYLGRHLIVAPMDQLTSGGIWATWDSAKAALSELRAEALRGVPLGSLDSIISRLRESARIIDLNKLIVKPITLVPIIKPTDSPHPQVNFSDSPPRITD